VETAERAFLANALILATGASAQWLGIDSEKRLMNKGVSACATCDGALFRGKAMAVVGGGDTAMEEALFLTRYATQVTVIHRRHELRASKIMQERAFKNEKIQFLWNSEVAEILSDDSGQVRGVVLADTQSGEKSELALQGVFIAIGHVPNSKLVKGKADLDENGYVKLAGRGTGTSVEGLFACGDVADHVYRQAVTAAGTGCQAAIDAERWLEAKAHAGAAADAHAG
jgi:thioredoxin reductase (NADPH)